MLDQGIILTVRNRRVSPFSNETSLIFSTWLVDGNVRFRSMIEKWLETYEKASPDERAEVEDTIQQLVADSGGRFIRKDKIKGYHLLDVDAIRARIQQSFRQAIWKQSKTKKKALVSSSTTTAEPLPLAKDVIVRKTGYFLRANEGKIEAALAS